MRKSFIAFTALAVLSIGCARTETRNPSAPRATPATASPTPTTGPTPTISGPLAVGTITLGNAIGPDKKIAAPMETFGVKDDVYASVETTGQGHAKLRAIFSRLEKSTEKRVAEKTVELDLDGPTWTEFHLDRDRDWPRGDYHVEVFLNGSPSPGSTKSFRIQ